MDPTPTVSATKRTWDAGRTDGGKDGVNPIYPPTTSLCGGYKKSALVQVMACCLFGTKPLSEPILPLFTDATRPWWVNPCHRLDLILGNIKIHLRFLSFFKSEIAQITEIPPLGPDYPHNLYHGCWSPGDERSQGIVDHHINLAIPEYSCFSSRRVNILTHFP